MRSAPDVILVGEIRDRETMEAAIALAGTGHLCIATLHANNCAETLDRIINMFPRDQHAQIFLDLSQYLRAILSQRLVLAKSGKRVAASEVMVNTPHVSELIKKGDVIGTARLAGIMAAKQTSNLIPLCHPLMLTKVSVEITEDIALPGLRVTATAKLTGKTGVEMEALTAVSVACLTIYDMAKAADKAMEISCIRLLEKSGGKSGDFRHPERAK